LYEDSPTGESIVPDVAPRGVTFPGPNWSSLSFTLDQFGPGRSVLSMYPEEQYAIRMIKAGVDGYLTKSSASKELVKAITKVHRGGKYVSPSLREAIAFTVEPGAEKDPHQLLSDRGYEVLCLIGSGKTVSEIADTTNLSVTTISTYCARMLEKMRMKTNAELTRYAIQQGLVE
jgi:two-component system invasion response regulator UvrY